MKTFSFFPMVNFKAFTYLFILLFLSFFLWNCETNEEEMNPQDPNSDNIPTTDTTDTSSKTVELPILVDNIQTLSAEVIIPLYEIYSNPINTDSLLSANLGTEANPVKITEINFDEINNDPSKASEIHLTLEGNDFTRISLGRNPINGEIGGYSISYSTNEQNIRWTIGISESNSGSNIFDIKSRNVNILSKYNATIISKDFNKNGETISLISLYSFDDKENNLSGTIDFENGTTTGNIATPTTQSGWESMLRFVLGQSEFNGINLFDVGFPAYQLENTFMLTPEAGVTLTPETSLPITQSDLFPSENLNIVGTVSNGIKVDQSAFGFALTRYGY